jgi:sugar/nucleoside kinase (ribokinase family)
MSLHLANRKKKLHSGRYLIVGGACLDKFLMTRSIVIGSKNRVQTQSRNVGGGGANVAVGLEHLDSEADVLLLAATGDDRDSGPVRHYLAERGVTLLWGTVPGQVTSWSDIVLSTDGGRSTIFSETGARTEPVPLDLVAEVLPRCDVCWLVAPTRNDQIRPIIQLAGRAKVPVFFGLGGAQIDQLGCAGLGEQLTVPVDLLICNRLEAAQLTGQQGLAEQLEALWFAGRVESVVITDGEGGIHALHQGNACHVPAYRDPCRPVVDETGAGDAAQAVIGHWLLHGRPLEEALRAAARQGFEAVTALGATSRLLTGPVLREYVKDAEETVAA